MTITPDQQKAAQWGMVIFNVIYGGFLFLLSLIFIVLIPLFSKLPVKGMYVEESQWFSQLFVTIFGIIAAIYIILGLLYIVLGLLVFRRWKAIWILLLISNCFGLFSLATAIPCFLFLYALFSENLRKYYRIMQE